MILTLNILTSPTDTFDFGQSIRSQIRLAGKFTFEKQGDAESQSRTIYIGNGANKQLS